MFFADRYHLHRYGRPVVGDTYLAMQDGPVASTVLDIADAAATGEALAFAYDVFWTNYVVVHRS